MLFEILGALGDLACIGCFLILMTWDKEDRNPDNW